MAESNAPSSPTLSSGPVPASPPTDAWLGNTVGPYHITRRIGAGRLGTIYEAQDTQELRQVALRVLAPEVTARADWRRTLEQVRRVVSANLVAMFDDGEHAGERYVVFELVKGGNTRDFLRTFGAFDWPEATRIAGDACRALIAAHAVGLAHGNVTPANILIANDGGVRLADLGLAQLAGPAPAHDHASPEQLRGAAADPLADICSLGACYYSLLIGKSPGRADRRGDPPDPCAAASDIPRACGRIVRRSMAVDPVRRYATAADLLNDLEAALDVSGEMPTVTTSYRSHSALRSGPVPAAPVGSNVARLLAPARQSSEIGRLGPYRVLKVLAEGGLGTVFQAEDPATKRPLALKVMQPDQAAGDVGRQRFQDEARAIAGLHDENVVRIEQVSEDRGLPYLAMELLEGESLEDILKRHDTVAVPEMLRIAREIARGLSAFHDRGLLHRDLKPSNVFLAGTSGPGTVKLLGFGLARCLEGPAPSIARSGVIVGTPGFTAPEQARGLAPDARSDLFSLGCVLYYLCTGQPPFRRDDPMATLIAQATEDPSPVRVLNPDVPSALANLVMSLLAKDPADRLVSAQAVLDALAEVERKASSGAGRRSAARMVIGDLASGDTAPSIVALRDTKEDMHFRTRREMGDGSCPACGAPAGNSLSLGWCLKCGYVARDTAPTSASGPGSTQQSGFDLSSGWVVVAGCVLVGVALALVAFLTPRDSGTWVWCGAGAATVGLLAALGGHIWAAILVMSERGEAGLLHFLEPTEVWGRAYRARPQTLYPLWLAAWGATAVAAGLILLAATY